MPAQSLWCLVATRHMKRTSALCWTVTLVPTWRCCARGMHKAFACAKVQVEHCTRLHSSHMPLELPSAFLPRHSACLCPTWV